MINKKTISLALIFLGLLVVHPTKAQDVSTSSEEIRKKVQEKIAQISQKPKGYVGTITDISINTIQARKYVFGNFKKSGEIFQIKTTENTTFADNKEEPRQIKFQDLAIGDFAIFMGKEINGGTLEASRIVVIKPLTPIKRVNLKLKITKVEKQKITASSQNEDYSVVIGKNTALLDIKGEKVDIKNLDEGNQIIVCGEKEENTIKARTIFVE